MTDASVVPHSHSDLAQPESASLDRNPAAVYLAGLTSAHSRRNMRHNLDVIADLLTGGQADTLTVNWGAVRYQHAAAIRARLCEMYAPATVNMMLAALRGTLRAAWRLGYLSAEDYQRAVDIERVKGETLPVGRDLGAGEIQALVKTCAADDTPAGVRDAAIIGLLATCGLRRSELVKLGIADFDHDTGKIAVRGGKGRKDRTVYAAGGALAALVDWLAIRGDGPDPLFVPVNKGGHLTIKPMTDQAVYNMLHKRAKQAGVDDFSPHDLRRTFVGDLLDAGADIAIVQKLAGHASPITTSRYDRRPEDAKRAATAKLHFPYQRRKKLL